MLEVALKSLSPGKVFMTKSSKRVGMVMKGKSSCSTKVKWLDRDMGEDNLVNTCLVWLLRNFHKELNRDNNA